MLDFLIKINIFIFDLIQFMYYISWNYLLYTILLIINLNLFLNAKTLINKLTWFFFILILVCTIIWCLSLETFGFIFLLTELTLIFLFFIVVTQFTSKLVLTQYKVTTIVTALLIFICLFDFEFNLQLTSISYYNSVSLIITADYFFLYYFLMTYLDITIYIALILSLFSIYFIILYFQLKTITSLVKNNQKTIYLIKKQNLIHQAFYTNYVRWFQ